MLLPILEFYKKPSKLVHHIHIISSIITTYLVEGKFLICQNVLPEDSVSLLVLAVGSVEEEEEAVVTAGIVAGEEMATDDFDNGCINVLFCCWSFKTFSGSLLSFWL